MRHARRPVLAASVVAILAGGVAPAVAAAPVAPALKSTLKQLKAKTSLPVLLPAVAPIDHLAGKPLYPVVTASAKRWDVVLGYVRGCNGANVCAAGNLAGVRTARALTAADGSPVALRGGVVGRYRGLQCGANCSAPSISFRSRGMSFTYQLKLVLKRGDTDRRALTRIANSALDAGPR